ncbi:uncharacterized protein I303_100367 [Kwoniella dejecticola CBS 10117]|uniref:Uncharacterized protein n=1 Tax=Kwoniella dejecticola CBS 10117 TaxID=1296121 RepID=A0A1A6AEQ3_9TREE|nr:uncharacterized protein I303_00367 [Kwoniella dejecticola CBS 10117]OBR88550.1 hypothetical protein I303_00367 [Kwoniella dejecticola CBS 10117]
MIQPSTDTRFTHTILRSPDGAIPTEFVFYGGILEQPEGYEISLDDGNAFTNTERDKGNEIWTSYRLGTSLDAFSDGPPGTRLELGPVGFSGNDASPSSGFSIAGPSIARPGLQLPVWQPPASPALSASPSICEDDTWGGDSGSNEEFFDVSEQGDLSDHEGTPYIGMDDDARVSTPSTTSEASEGDT